MGRDFSYLVSDHKLSYEEMKNKRFEDIDYISRYNDIIGQIENECFTRLEIINKINDFVKLLNVSNITSATSNVADVAEAIQVFATVLKYMSVNGVAYIDYD